MAKDQNLSLNPTKISGVCGRLMCCLKFENDMYCENCPHQTAAFKPRQGNRVIVDGGEGKVVAVSFSRRNATILLDTNKTVVAGWDEILPVNSEDLESDNDSAHVEEPKPAPKIERSERPRRTDAFNRRYNRAENVEHHERPTRPRGDKIRRQPRRDNKK